MKDQRVEAERRNLLPWAMAILGMTVVMITNGLTKTGITAFDTAILQEFGWTRGQFKFRDFLTLLVVGASAPFAGYLIDRFGIRRLMTAGLVLFSLLYLLYGRIENLTHLYLIHVGFGAVLVLAGVNAAVILSSQWFSSKRGTAVGIAVMGSSLGGMVFPWLIVKLMESGGWREAFSTLAMLPAAAAIVVYLWVDSPANKGCLPYGGGAADPQVAAGKSSDLTLSQVVRTRSFWALSVVAMTTFYSLLSVSSHLFLHIRDLGFDAATASTALVVLFAPGFISKFLFGLLADYFPVKRVFFANLAIMFSGILILASLNRDLVWVGIGVVGFGWGGAYILGALQGVNCFGITHSGKILGCLSLMDAIAGGVGVWVTGLLFDRFGSYRIPFSMLAILLAVAMVCSLFIRNETQPRDGR